MVAIGGLARDALGSVSASRSDTHALVQSQLGLRQHLRGEYQP